MSFSTQEKIWLVQHYSPSEGYTKLKRDFIRHFEITNKHNVPRLTAFKRVLMKFDEKGEIQDLRSNKIDLPLVMGMCRESNSISSNTPELPFVRLVLI